jgi:four helix bundle protein
VREAQRGVSTKDFKNKLGTSLKEADEACYRLDIIDDTKIYPIPKGLYEDCQELITLLVTIIKNS